MLFARLAGVESGHPLRVVGTHRSDVDGAAVGQDGIELPAGRIAGRELGGAARRRRRGVVVLRRGGVW